MEFPNIHKGNWLIVQDIETKKTEMLMEYKAKRQRLENDLKKLGSIDSKWRLSCMKIEPLN